MWEQLKTALEKEYAFEKEMFEDPKWVYKRLCEGQIEDLGRGPVEMIWLYLDAFHKALRALMERLETGEDLKLEDAKAYIDYKRMMETIEDGLGQGT
jgi:hypothetical protein